VGYRLATLPPPARAEVVTPVSLLPTPWHAAIPGAPIESAAELIYAILLGRVME
jgi:hypothetical protein